MTPTNHRLTTRSKIARGFMLGAGVTSLLAAAPALGQNADTAATETVTVTGSRITQPGFASPTPVSAVTADNIEKTAVTIGDALAELPAVTASGPSQSGSGVGSGGGGQATINLRNLGATRTLTLFDGQRFVGDSGAGTPNTDMFPSGLISRVDIVTGGASAAYGSDAVAGVANFILNKEFIGLKGSVTGGISGYGDNALHKEVLTYGTMLFGDKLHFEANVEFYRNVGVTRNDRDVSMTSTPFKGGANLLATGTTPLKNVTSWDSVSTAATQGGLVVGSTTTAGKTSTLLKGTAFDTNGNPYQFVYTADVGSAWEKDNGDPLGVHTLFGDTGINSPETRGNSYFRGDYDINEFVAVHADVLYGVDKDNYSGGRNYLTGSPLAPVIKVDNAFLPAATAALMKADGLASITLGEADDQMPYRVDNTNTTFRASIATDFKWGDWKGEFGYEHGDTRINTHVNALTIVPNFVLAVDAVTVTAANVGSSGQAIGSVVCRDTLTNPKDGCVPYNTIGVNKASAAAVAWSTGVEKDFNYVHQDAFEFNMNGPLFSAWAGDISGAVGMDYRFESYRQDSDALSQAFNSVTLTNGIYRTGNVQPAKGRNEVTEGYVELSVPLLKDAPMAESWNMDIAARETDYRISGSASTWKIGTEYQPIDDVRFRLTRSHDIRAPALSELFASGGQGASTSGLTVNLPSGTYVTTTGTRINTIGNTNLKPEKSDTLTYGAVFTPSFLPNFSFSVDAYFININNYISSVSTTNAATFCNQGVAQFCAQFLPGTTPGQIATTISQPVNLSKAKNDGVDFEGSYRAPLSDFINDWDGSIAIHTVVGYVTHQTVSSPPSAPIDRAGDDGNGVPHWRGTLGATYDNGPYEVFTQMRFIGAGKQNTAYVVGVDTDNNSVPIVVYFDTNFQYAIPDIDGDWKLSANVSNLFDQPAPFIPVSGNNPYYTNKALYDVIGRSFRLIAKFSY